MVKCIPSVLLFCLYRFNDNNNSMYVIQVSIINKQLFMSGVVFSVGFV